MSSPRPNARPKCSNCVGSGKHCSHADLIADIQWFKKYRSVDRVAEDIPFFKNEPINTWGRDIGLSADQIQTLKRRNWSADLGDFVRRPQERRRCESCRREKA